VPLSEWIRRDPEAVLGRETARRFRGELPFLFKVLAPARALSIQAHPDARQAREGFARENAAGLAPDAPARSYRDPNPKPELVCALAPFQALCGFRPAAEIAASLEALGVPQLAELAQGLRRTPGRAGVEQLFRALWCREAGAGRELSRAVAGAAARPPPAARGLGPALGWVTQLACEHPGDVGVLAPLLLNLVELAPGQALFLPAGELHAYLRGVAVEIMASSDNVLRGGLTEKHVDVPELLRTLTFRDGPAPLVPARPRAPGEEVYTTPAREFELSLLRTGAVAFESPPERSVEILLCTQGKAVLRDPVHGEAVTLARGRAALVPAALPRYRVEGDAVVHRAGVPR
jgi:mannose-6-phosphate isomerase